MDKLYSSFTLPVTTEDHRGLVGAVDSHDTQFIIALDAQWFGGDQEAVEIGGIFKDILAHLGTGIDIPNGDFDVPNQIGRGNGYLSFIDLLGGVER
jgi:hypothetical protein